MKIRTIPPLVLRRWIAVVLLILMSVLSIQQAVARNKKEKKKSVPAAEETQPAADKKSEAPGKATEKPAAPAGEEKAAEAKPKPAGPPVVPGGGLAAHEKRGGHLISRHVGKSQEDLVARLRSDPGIFSASSFTSMAVAEAVVGVAIKARQKQISSWLKTSEDRTTLDFTANKPVGIMVRRRNMQAVPASSLRLVLERDPRFQPHGWRIITGYPQL